MPKKNKDKWNQKRCRVTVFLEGESKNKFKHHLERYPDMSESDVANIIIRKSLKN